MHCNANSSASSASHHTLFMQRQEQATSERLWLALGHYSKRQHLEPHFSAVFDLFFFYYISVFVLLFLSSPGISSIPISSHPFLRGPAPRQRYSSRPTSLLLWPTSPDGTRSSLLSSYPPRQSRSLCRWPIVVLACVLPLPCSPRRSRVKAVAQGVCQQKKD